MSWYRISLLLRTARHLRAEQLAFWLLYRLQPRHAPRVAAHERRQWPRRWLQPELAAPSMCAAFEFELLGERGAIDGPESWNDSTREKLWLYHLHYLDDLKARGFPARAAEHVELVERWIADNPPGHGVGWEPYPLSLRIVNLVKWLERQANIKPRWLDSLATQAEALARRIEYHLLGNHLFANGKALVFAGAFLAGPQSERWLQRGLAILQREIPEQFLADGGHFERSPMYHAILTTDLCDLVQLADVSGLPALRDQRAPWAEVLSRALAWLDAMIHPDGEIAFFNDAAFGVAPRPADVRAYAKALLGPMPTDKLNDFALRTLATSGYLRVDLPHRGAAIVDAAPLGPDYLPAHGHADTLAFELSLFGARVLVNSGTSCYGESEERLRQRGTAAHNTVVIDGENSSEVWAGFRVARRARPTLHEATRRDGRIVIDASHDGYRRLRGRNLHRRRFIFEEAALRIEDAVEGPFRSATGYLHLHPDVAVEPFDAAARTARLRLAGGQTLDVAVSGARLAVEPGTWHPRFGATVPTRTFVLAFEGARAIITLRWRAGK